MKNQFNLLKESVQKHNDPTMNAIVDLLENYNNGLTAYFSKREISREFLDTFDSKLTLQEIEKKFDFNDKSNVAISCLFLDLNLLARSTWYYEAEDGRILTGEKLYERKAVYWASYKTKKEVYATEEDEKEASELNEYIECDCFWGDDSKIPQPIGAKEVNVDLPGCEKPDSVNEMVALIKFDASTLERFLKK